MRRFKMSLADERRFAIPSARANGGAEARVEGELDSALVVARYEYTRRGAVQPTYAALGFSGKRGNPDFHNSYRTVEQREAAIASWKDGLAARAAMMAKIKAERSGGHTLKVGDILYSSWGYDQTNIDFYQVVAATEKTVTIRQVKQKLADEQRGQPYADNVLPVVNGFYEESDGCWKDRAKAMVKRASASNTVRIASYASAWKWGGEAKSQTGYGYGH